MTVLDLMVSPFTSDGLGHDTTPTIVRPTAPIMDLVCMGVNERWRVARTA
jgi:hypothetical protein